MRWPRPTALRRASRCPRNERRALPRPPVLLATDRHRRSRTQDDERPFLPHSPVAPQYNGHGGKHPMFSRRATFALSAAVALAAASSYADEPAQVFARSCAICHGKEGKPSAVFEKQGVKDFTNPAWQK